MQIIFMNHGILSFPNLEDYNQLWGKMITYSKYIFRGQKQPGEADFSTENWHNAPLQIKGMLQTMTHIYYFLYDNPCQKYRTNVMYGLELNIRCWSKMRNGCNFYVFPCKLCRGWMLLEIEDIRDVEIALMLNSEKGSSFAAL